MLLTLLLYATLLLALLFGLVITLMTLPGLWFMLAATVAYAWLTHWRFVGAGTLIALLLLAVLGEIIELAGSGSGARRAGAGRRGLGGALIGGVLGGIFLSFIPIPAVSQLAGVCLGTFLGATIGEMSAGRELGDSARVGFGAAAGRLKGTLAKVGLGMLMLLLAMWMALPIHFRGRSAAHVTAPAVRAAPAL